MTELIDLAEMEDDTSLESEIRASLAELEDEVIERAEHRFFESQDDGRAPRTLAEAFVARLSRLENVRVISSTSAMRFRGSTRTLPEIARSLFSTCPEQAILDKLEAAFA